METIAHLYQYSPESGKYFKTHRGSYDVCLLIREAINHQAQTTFYIRHYVAYGVSEYTYFNPAGQVITEKAAKVYELLLSK